MKKLFDSVSFKCSKVVTQQYSTSFSLGIRLLNKSIRDAIFSIYGFVRFADEIVDTFHDYNKEELLINFESDYYTAIDKKISLNPILHSFQITVDKYNINDDLIQAFLKSMKIDLQKKEHNENEIRQYIYGSADVVGLMCLKVFVGGEDNVYQELKPSAMKLGSAFQKVNFLRDLNADLNQLNRIYFPILKENDLTEEIKNQLIEDINKDYKEALKGIKRLPDSARNGVYIAYLYYKKLTKKISKTPANILIHKRVRISNALKIWLIITCFLTPKRIKFKGIE